MQSKLPIPNKTRGRNDFLEQDRQTRSAQKTVGKDIIIIQVRILL